MRKRESVIIKKNYDGCNIPVGVFEKYWGKTDYQDIRDEFLLSDLDLHCRAFSDKYLKHIDTELGEILLRCFTYASIVFDGLDRCYLRTVGFDFTEGVGCFFAQSDDSFLETVLQNEMKVSISNNAVLFNEEEYDMSEILTEFEFNGSILKLANEVAILYFDDMEYTYPKEIIYFLNDVDETERNDFITLLTGNLLFEKYGLATPSDLKIGFDIAF